MFPSVSLNPLHFFLSLLPFALNVFFHCFAIILFSSFALFVGKYNLKREYFAPFIGKTVCHELRFCNAVFFLISFFFFPFFLHPDVLFASLLQHVQAPKACIQVTAPEQHTRPRPFVLVEGTTPLVNDDEQASAGTLSVRGSLGDILTRGDIVASLQTVTVGWPLVCSLPPLTL